MNKLTTLIFRIVGLALMFFGTVMFFSPIIYTIKFIPFIGYMVAMGISLIVWIFAFIFTLTFGSLTIGVAWVFYRPKIGIPLLIIVFIGISIMFFAFKAPTTTKTF